jgi:hypothetical protein
MELSRGKITELFGEVENTGLFSADVSHRDRYDSSFFDCAAFSHCLHIYFSGEEAASILCFF